MLLDDLLDLLSSGGGYTQGTQLFAANLPAAAADRVIYLSETGGRAPLHTMNASPGNAYIVQQPRVQVVVRGAPEGYQGARQDAENVFRLLDGVRDRTINGVHYLSIMPVQDIFSLGPDENLRPMLAFNVDVMKGPSTSTST